MILSRQTRRDLEVELKTHQSAGFKALTKAKDGRLFTTTHSGVCTSLERPVDELDMIDLLKKVG